MPLTPPPRDGNGDVVPHDHPEIGDDDPVIRRISPEHVVPDPKAGTGRRISTMAFQPSSHGNKGMSIDIEVLILEAQLDPKSFVTKPPFIGSVWFTARTLRNETLKVGYDPLEDNPYHGEVWGNFTVSRKKRLLEAARWYVEIDGVALHL